MQALLCWWAEMGKSGLCKEPTRLLNLLPCPLGKKEIIIITGPDNPPYLQPRGLNCKGHSSEGISPMHMKGASVSCQTVMHDPRAQHPDQMFLSGSRFWRGKETGVPGEKPSSQVEID